MTLMEQAGATVAGVLVGALALRVFLKSVTVEATQKGGEKALDRLSDWAKWMAGIQTATLAALGLIVNKQVAMTAQLWVVFTVVLMGAALFVSAWVLSSIANVSLAITGPIDEGFTVTPDGRSKAYDVYERTMYVGFREARFDWLRHLTLNYMVTLQHWLWGLGLIAFAVVLLNTSVFSPQPVSEPSRATHLDSPPK